MSSPAVVEQGTSTSEKQRPESVEFAYRAWQFLVAGEAIHQILNVAASILDPSEMKSQVNESLSQQQRDQLSPELMNGLVTMSAVVVGLFSLCVCLFMWLMARSFHRGGKGAKTARRVLSFFGFYFAIRMLMLFGLTAAGTTMPTELLLVDGMLQILIGVGGALAVIFGSRKDSIDWVGETEGSFGLFR